MIFLRYETFRGYLRMYPVTVLIVAINIVMFVITMLNGGSDDALALCVCYFFACWVYAPLL
ncbi:hypothetical protein D3C84_942050 [compost metagenome]